MEQTGMASVVVAKNKQPMTEIEQVSDYHEMKPVIDETHTFSPGLRPGQMKLLHSGSNIQESEPDILSKS